MAYEKLSVHVRGIAPTIMHNGQLADPLNPIVRSMKEITAKKNKKTDADIIELARLEFVGSLYLDDNGHPAWPGENLESMIRSGARTLRRGKDVEKAIMCDGNWPLIYDGPKDPSKLWEDDRFRKVATVKVSNSRIIRTRPMFSPWELKFDLHFEPSLVNRDDVVRWLEIGGRDIGLSDWRPKFGRFEVVAVN